LDYKSSNEDSATFFEAHIRFFSGLIRGKKKPGFNTRFSLKLKNIYCFEFTIYFLAFFFVVFFAAAFFFAMMSPPIIPGEFPKRLTETYWKIILLPQTTGKHFPKKS
jgi:hypothetical protein